MTRANLIPSVLFGAILASIIITSPEAHDLQLPQVDQQRLEFSDTPRYPEPHHGRLESPLYAPADVTVPYRHARTTLHNTPPTIAVSPRPDTTLQAG